MLVCPKVRPTDGQFATHTYEQGDITRTFFWFYIARLNFSCRKNGDQVQPWT